MIRSYSRPCVSALPFPPQVGCPGQEDVIRSYSCLPYTWDEPSAPSPRLAVELPGGRQLGTFKLDQVSA